MPDARPRATVGRPQLQALDDSEPSKSIVRLFKHLHLGMGDVMDVWSSQPLFYPAKPPAHWLMLSEVGGRVLVVPLAPSRSGDLTKCRPIGCYEASSGLTATYRRDPDEH